MHSANPTDTCVDVCIDLIHWFNLKVPNSIIRRNIQFHSHYPSLLSVTDFLTELSIKNFATRTTISKLSDITLPFIAHLDEGKGLFVLVTSIGQDRINYLQAGVKISRPVVEFEKFW